MSYPAARLMSAAIPVDRAHPVPDAFRKVVLPAVLDLAERKGVLGIPLVPLDTVIPAGADAYQEHATVHHRATGEVVFAMEVRFAAPAEQTVGFTVAPCDEASCSWLLAIAAVGVVLLRGARSAEGEEKVITPCPRHAPACQGGGIPGSEGSRRNFRPPKLARTSSGSRRPRTAVRACQHGAPQATVGHDRRVLPDEDAASAREIIAYFRAAQREASLVATAALDATSSGMDAGRTIVEEVGGFYDAYLQRLVPPFRSDCSAGCDFCCHFYASATVPEVIGIAALIFETWTAEEREELLVRLERYRAETSALTPREVPLSRRPCPLLRNRRCSVYDVRPLACRGWHSKDVEACKKMFAFPTASTTRVPMDVRGALTTQLSRGIADGVARRGCMSTKVGLVSGLATVLRNPGAADAWRQGQRSFAEASDKALRRAMPDLDVQPA